MLITLGLIGIEIGACADDSITAIPKATMGTELLLPPLCSSWLLLGCRGAGAKKRNREGEDQASSTLQPHTGGQGSPKAWHYTLFFPCHPIANGANATLLAAQVP